MNMRRPSALWVLLLFFLATAHPAWAWISDTPADFGPSPISGQEANDTIQARKNILHFAMACGNEFSFAQGFALASHYGEKGYTPQRDLADWPVTLMIGKAAWLNVPTEKRGPCHVRITGDITSDWGKLTRDGSIPAEQPADAVNRAYRELYDGIEGVGAPVCSSVARPDGNDGVSIYLSDACLARQIRAVMTDPGHGPWTQKDGPVKPELPGTDGLPCVSEFSFKIKDFKGDWDQAVIEYTRLTSLLYRYGRGSETIGDDIQASIDVLNRRFLTLRSSPDQGATAREEFNLLTSCGNQPNQFGDAIDTVNGNSTDPGVDRYSKDAKDAVGKKSFWDSFLRFLAALVAVAVFVAAAALVGAIAGSIVGAFASSWAAGAVAAAAIAAIAFISLAGGGVQETENHLLMENSSRYIKNKLMMAELSAQDEKEGFKIIADLNEDVRQWLLNDLQRIAREDFVEYNSKPYNRLSHASIINLLDYACDVSWNYDDSRFILDSDKKCDAKDRAVVDAASAVLDLSAAKDAIGSFEGRRLPPYRRLVAENYKYDIGRSLFELSEGADSQIAALQIWTGQMRHAPNGKAEPSTFGNLMWYSTSKYRPDPVILGIAIEKKTRHEQKYLHHTREHYSSGNGWLITAGGSDEGPAQGFNTPLGLTVYPPFFGNPNNNRGVGVPTTLMTSALIADRDGKPEGRTRVKQFLRFEGNIKDWGLNDGASVSNGLNTGDPLWSFSDNNCVTGSFACGLGLQLPSDFDNDKCRTLQISLTFFIVDSKKCPSFDDGDNNTGNDLFIAIFQSSMGWGFFEVAQQDDFHRSIEEFADAIKDKNNDRMVGWKTASGSDKVEYFSVTQKKLLTFTPGDEDFGLDHRACGVVNHGGGASFTISNVPAAKADDCVPVGPRIFIDLNDAMNPIRRGDGGLALESFVR